MDNTKIADHLQTIAFLFLKANDQWRSRAFSKVAEGVRAARFQLTFSDGKLVTKIDGAGKATKQVIEQFVATGTSNKLEMLKAKLPAETYERFSARTCKRKCNAILAPLTKANVDWGYAGSLRRGSKTVHDVDVIICLKNQSERRVVEEALEAAGLKANVRNGREKVGVSVPINSQGRSFTLDLNFTTPESRGAHYLYFTGPKAFNIEQRAAAKASGLKLNQKGLWKGNKRVAGKTEEEMFAALGCEFVAPSNRS